jgi:CO/xanthine dehydrogenase Mo-binding subunit
MLTNYNAPPTDGQMNTSSGRTASTAPKKRCPRNKLRRAALGSGDDDDDDGDAAAAAAAQQRRSAEAAARKVRARAKRKEEQATATAAMSETPREIPDPVRVTRWDPPSWALCPLTGEIMVDPVVTRSGTSYEREALEVSSHCVFFKKKLSLFF